MEKSDKKVRTPLFHIAKREAMPWYFGVIVRAIAVVAALIVAGVLVAALTGKNPIQVYATMFDGVFGHSDRIWNMGQKVAILLGISLAVTLISTLLSVLLAKFVAGIFASSLAPAVRNLLGDYAEMMSGEHFSALVTGCASAAVSLVLFIPCFILV
ncbi:MAG: hypothetical protein IJP22_00800, partial [Clostridia bacterium]|nr:hypothetical protein [Clostridia bacterium]